MKRRKLPPIRAAFAEAVYDFLLTCRRDRVGLWRIYEGLIRIDPPWERRWTRSMIHQALNDLAAAGRVRLESLPEAKFVTVVLTDRSGETAGRRVRAPER